MQLEYRELENRTCLLLLSGNLDVQGVMEVEDGLLAYCQGRHRRVRVDLSETGFAGSLGIGLLLRAIKTAAAQGVDILLWNPSPVVAIALDIAGLSPFIRTSRDDPQMEAKGVEGSLQSWPEAKPTDTERSNHNENAIGGSS